MGQEKRKSNENAIVNKCKPYGGAIPEYGAHRERLEKGLLPRNRWEWSDEDLLLSCVEYSHKSLITKDDALKELPKLRHYLEKEELSLGFDIDVVPSIGLRRCSINPISRTEKQLQKYKDLAELGLESYNKENDKTDYEVIKVMKVNITPGIWDWYYLTFTAKDVSPRGRYRSPKIFQAKVFVPKYQPDRAAEATICRIKPKY